MGESRAVSFAVSAEKQLQLTDLDGSKALVPGSYGLTFTNGAGQTVHDVFVVPHGAEGASQTA